MEQVEEICEHIVLINQGKNVLQGSVKDVKNHFKENLFQFKYQGVLPAGFQEKAQIIEEKNQQVTLQLKENEDSNDFLRYLIQNKVHITSFNEILPTLNEIFIKQVGNGEELNLVNG